MIGPSTPEPPCVQYPVFDDVLFMLGGQPYSLTLGQPFRMSRLPTRVDGLWRVTVSLAPGLRVPITFAFMSEAKARYLIANIRKQLALLPKQ